MNPYITGGDAPASLANPSYLPQSWIPVVSENVNIAIGYYPIVENTFEDSDSTITLEGQDFSLKSCIHPKGFKYMTAIAPIATYDAEAGIDSHAGTLKDPLKRASGISNNDAPLGSAENPSEAVQSLFNWQSSGLYKLKDILYYTGWQFTSGVGAARVINLPTDFTDWIFAEGIVPEFNSHSQYAVVNNGLIEDASITAEDYTYIWYMNRQGTQGYTRNVDKSNIFENRLKHNEFLEIGWNSHFNVKPQGVASARVLSPTADPGHGKFLSAIVAYEPVINSRNSAIGGGLMTTAALPILNAGHTRNDPLAKDEALFKDGRGWSQSGTIRIVSIRHDETPVPAGDYIWPVELTSRSGEKVTVNLTITIPDQSA